jgi:hypothetical protein
MKPTPVTVYIDGVPVGTGALLYNDLSLPLLFPAVTYHCDETPVYIDNEVVPLVLCWDDIVALGFGGLVEREINVPVYVGSVEVGSATIRVSDSYATDLIATLMFTAMLIPVLILIIYVATIEKRSETK